MSLATVRPALPADGPTIARIQLASWTETYGPLNPALITNFDLERTAANWSQAAIDPLHRLRLAEGPGPDSSALDSRALDSRALDSRAIGFAASGPAEDDPSLGELHAIYLLPQAFGRGAGRLLAEDALLGLRQSGFAECVLWVARDNPRARGFYEHLGFTADGATDNWRALPTVRYRLPLS